MKKYFTLVLLLTISLNSFAQKTWTADPNHSKLSFSIIHLGISSIDGLFNNFEASLKTSKDDFSDATFEMTADVNSINTQIDARDQHLRSDEFFDVVKFPKMTFKSTSIKKDGKEKGRYILVGNLSMHGITKQITLHLWYRGTALNPANNSNVAGFQITGSLKRSDFDLGSKYPEPMLSNEVKIKADCEFSIK